MTLTVRTRCIIASLTLVATVTAAASMTPRDAKSDISDYCGAINYYHDGQGEYPARLPDMLERYPAWRIVKDPWDRDYFYSLTRPDFADKDGPFYIWTLGKDGMLGGDGDNADVGSWNLKPPWSTSCR